MNFQTLQQSLECYCEKLSEIDIKGEVSIRKGLFLPNMFCIQKLNQKF